MKLTFENLTAEGYAAFVLAIIFTIISIAGFIVFARHKDLGKVMSAVISLVFPFLAVFCWTYLILNVIKYDTVMSLAISVGAAAGYVLLALCFALILMACLKNRGPRQPKEKKEEKVEQVEEQLAQENLETVTTDDKTPKGPKLITMRKNLMLGHSQGKALQAPVEESVEEPVVEEKPEEEQADKDQTEE